MSKELRQRLWTIFFKLQNALITEDMEIDLELNKSVS